MNQSGMSIDSGFLSVMVFLAITPLVSLVAAVLAWRKRPTPGARSMAVLSLAAALWSLGYNLELYTLSMAGKVFWAEFRYFGIGVIPVAWFVFGLQFSGWGKIISPLKVAVLMVIPALTVGLAFSNPAHGWVWSKMALQPSEYLDFLAVEHGFWFWIFTIYSYGLIIAGTVMTLGTLGRSLPLYRWQFALVFLGGVIPALFNLMNLIGYSPFFGIDLTSAAFSISGFLFSLAFSRFNLFDIVTVARNTVFDTLEDAILVLDANGKVLDANAAGRKLANLPSPNAAGVSIEHINAPALLPVREIGVEDLFAGEVTVGSDGSLRWYDLRSNPLVDQTDKYVGRVIVWHDITALKKVEEQLRYLSLHDRLTGLYNRLYFEEEIGRLARGRGWQVAVLVGDLDGLKAINDSQGHVAGDDLILRAADVLRRSFRTGDVVARVGGDEFAALLPNAGEAAVLNVIGRIRVQEMDEKERYPAAKVDFSLGYAIAEVTDDLRAAYKLADARMYEQKKGRKAGLIEESHENSL